VDDTIVVDNNEMHIDRMELSERSNDTRSREKDGEHTLLDHILSRIEPIPKLLTVSDLLQDEMDTISKNYRSQNSYADSMAAKLQEIDERDEEGIKHLWASFREHDGRIRDLEREKDAHSELCTKAESGLARVEAKLTAIEVRVSKEISNLRIGRQSENLDASAGKTGSYDNLKRKCRKLEDKLNILEQRTTTEKSLYRLLDSNTKYTRELNDGVNSWKKQCDKEHSEMRILKEQTTTLEERASSMGKLIQSQPALIADLASQLRLQRDE
jgi:hypothetical protein